MFNRNIAILLLLSTYALTHSASYDLGQKFNKAFFRAGSTCGLIGGTSAYLLLSECSKEAQLIGFAGNLLFSCHADSKLRKLPSNQYDAHYVKTHQASLACRSIGGYAFGAVIGYTGAATAHFLAKNIIHAARKPAARCLYYAAQKISKAADALAKWINDKTIEMALNAVLD